MTSIPLLGGKYVLGDRIGMGGMGVVHRAAQPALARDVAIKLLHRHLAEDPHIASRFRAEALTAAQLSHPNLVTVIDYGETELGTPFLVMELVQGRSLGEIVRSGGDLPAARAVALVRQILAGLSEAHAAGVVHADVKSDNVLVEDHGHGERVKVVDFGLARIGRRAPRDDGAVAGVDRQVSGTPEYMAPEVIRGEAPTFAADLYGTGVILYELLTGAPPFTGGSPEEIMVRHLDDEVVPPSLRRPERAICSALEAVVARALAKRPADRFGDAEAFAEALAAVSCTPAQRWCHACGAQVLAAAAACPACGATMPPLRARTGSLQTTGVWRGPAGPVSTAVADEHDLRRTIGDAIASGMLDVVARGYVELAAHLVARQQIHAAIAELEEGVDLLTAGDGPVAAHGPAAAVVAALLPLYEALGDPRAAYAGAAAHWLTWTGVAPARP